LVSTRDTTEECVVEDDDEESLPGPAVLLERRELLQCHLKAPVAHDDDRPLRRGQRLEGGDARAEAVPHRPEPLGRERAAEVRVAKRRPQGNISGIDAQHGPRLLAT
jgi:hypothetical protein